MNSHELAREMLAAPDGEVVCSVDISTCDNDADSRCFGAFVEINSLPSDDGFGSNEVQLLFVGNINIVAVAGAIEKLEKENEKMREALIGFKKQYRLSPWIHRQVDEAITK